MLSGIPGEDDLAWIIVENIHFVKNNKNLPKYAGKIDVDLDILVTES